VALKRDIHMVTGAFGYSGRFIARLLLRDGRRLRTLTNHPNIADPLAQCIEAIPLRFDDEVHLVRALDEVTVVYNTYWIRFDYNEMTHDIAARNAIALIHAAAKAGVHRLVHVSITNPALDSPLPYFRAKAEVEQALVESGLSYAILRPTVFFGGGDILINNIAWLLRRWPLFAVANGGSYRVQPVHVNDLALLAVAAGADSSSTVIDAVGPEVYEFDDLVHLVARSIGARSVIVRLPPWAVMMIARVLGLAVSDVMLTADELKGLMSNLLVSTGAPTCTTRFSEWLRQSSHELGRAYASELRRHYHGSSS
jgi:uncharacterized protein YbjT (DUF2867 family)